MSLRRLKKKLFDAAGTVAGTVTDAAGTVADKVSEMTDTSLTIESAKKELIDDIEKGVQIFDEIGLPQDVGDDYQEQIANFALEKLEEAWKRVDRQTEE